MSQKFIKFIFLPTYLILFTIACGDSSQEIKLIEKITDTGIIFSEKDIEDAGFKINKRYKTEDLPKATKAFYGWKSVGEEGRKDFEVRIYPSHEDAIEFGKFYADEATGTEDAAVSGLSNQVSVLAAAADWTIAANVNMRPLSAIVAADKYLYLVGGGGTTDGVYDAGKYLIKLYGV